MSKQGLVDPPGSAQPRDHRDYVSDPQFAAEYAAYQARYADNPKECDKRTAQLVLQSLQSTQPSSSRPRILDIGCSTGNFLQHLKRLNVNANLIGGDLMKSAPRRMPEEPSADRHLFRGDGHFQSSDRPAFRHHHR